MYKVTVAFRNIIIKTKPRNEFGMFLLLFD